MSEGRCPRPKLRERIRPKPARSSSRTRILVRFPFSMCSSGKVQAHYLKLWVALEIRIRTLKELVNEPICAEWAMQYQYSPLGCLTAHSAAHNGMINNKLAPAGVPFTSDRPIFCVWFSTTFQKLTAPFWRPHPNRRPHRDVDFLHIK